MPLSNILAQEARHGLDQPDRGCQAILAGTEAVALRIWGKILGGTAGFAIGGPIGALIGAAAGHYDFYREEESAAARLTRPRSGSNRSRSPARRGVQRSAETRRIAFATAVIVLGAQARQGRRPGHPRRDQGVQAHLPDRRRRGRRRRPHLQRGQGPRRTGSSLRRQIAALFGRDPVLLGELLIGLFELARADGEITPAETDFLRRVAAVFGFDGTAFEQLRARFSATARTIRRAGDAYAVLGHALLGDDEIQQTYRKLVREHHPDRLVAKGMPEEMIEQANKVLAAINAATDHIAKERKLR